MSRTLTTVLTALAAMTAGCDWNGQKPDGSGEIECTQVQVAPRWRAGF